MAIPRYPSETERLRLRPFLSLTETAHFILD
jgi:hypothetical protein